MSNAFDIKIRRGSTFSRVLRWEAPPIVYRPITAILKQAPARITAPAHGLPNGWRVAVVSVKGMKEINARSHPPKVDDYHKATVIDANTIELNSVNASEFSAYVGGGYLQYLTPVDLAGSTARMKIKDRIGGTTLLDLTIENGGIALDNTLKTITITITAAVTAAFTWSSGVSDLELVSASGVVTPFPSEGVAAVTVGGEVTV